MVKKYAAVILLLFSLEYFCFSFTASPNYITKETALWASDKKGPSFWESVNNLWDEIIEVSTYGPSERRILKARRAEAARNLERGQETASGEDVDLSVEAFQRASKQQVSQQDGSAATFDGYNLRDLLIQKWGVPLDIDFQRQPGPTIYCTVMPVAFGSRKCRHSNELEYLMHLQAVVEVLQKYDQLDLFISFIENTNKKPKVGTDSVPIRLNLSKQDMKTIL
mmetsp:Transcript_32756/g.48512  ORF Transcript_32756/g.48512 Transcript_32756/m.48512 type:complete len:223 (+) Transcript_32756:3-671(+)|eukprot:CAMPEP_0194259688 /NCGR_PEP_ID=MMETSP0158-20130606/44186_1 /TAXON_ID=33649 /ORGANISM="Thalassionema nitzschioides, Strain L26-B" /LENGTH=222 /DNA_ID=CAMNT_0038999585 /DNA_START=21 /DNA_END=689 /DNA_ORIENTATION=+